MSSLLSSAVRRYDPRPRPGATIWEQNCGRSGAEAASFLSALRVFVDYQFRVLGFGGKDFGLCPHLAKIALIGLRPRVLTKQFGQSLLIISRLLRDFLQQDLHGPVSNIPRLPSLILRIHRHYLRFLSLSSMCLICSFQLSISVCQCSMRPSSGRSLRHSRRFLSSCSWTRRLSVEIRCRSVLFRTIPLFLIIAWVGRIPLFSRSGGSNAFSLPKLVSGAIDSSHLTERPVEADA